MKFTSYNLYSLNCDHNEKQSYSQFSKVTRAYCNSSNILCKNVTCHVKPISRTEGYLNYKCYMPNPIRGLMGSFAVYHQHLLGGNFNYLFSYKSIKLCDIEKYCEMYPLLKPFIKFANDSVFKGVYKKTCPYGPGWLQVVNGTVTVAARTELDKLQFFPNGNYRVDGKLWNKKDDNIASISLYIKTKFRSNTMEFFDKFWNRRWKYTWKTAI